MQKFSSFGREKEKNRPKSVKGWLCSQPFNLCPIYISGLLEIYKPTRSLRSSSRNLLLIPRSKLKSFGDRAFSVSAPKLWNDILETIKCNVDLNAFKRNLKTYLFKRYFNE